jgi:hypothetical protein
MHTPSLGLALAGLASLAALGCAFDSEPAARTPARIVVDTHGITAIETDLGYTVELERCRAAIDTLEFTTNGEMHASLLQRAWGLVVPDAQAHPGHYAGGEVVGELPGRHVVDWLDDGALVGEATLLDTHYEGTNFSFTRARPGDDVTPDDPLGGHTMELAGTATRGDERWELSVVLDQDEGRRVVGLPLELQLPGDEEVVLGLALLPHDPIEGDTMLDGLDFAALDGDGDGVIVIEPGSEAYNLLVRATQSHDGYGVTVL